MKNKIIAIICGLPVLLTTIFAVLKLCNIVNWEWQYVIAPIWCPIAIISFLVPVAFLFAIMTALWDNH